MAPQCRLSRRAQRPSATPTASPDQSSVRVTAKDQNNASSAAVTHPLAIGTTTTLYVGPDVTINDGDTFSGTGLYDAAFVGTAKVNYGDGSDDQDLTLNNGVFSPSHLYTDNGTFTITVTPSPPTIRMPH